PIHSAVRPIFSELRNRASADLFSQSARPSSRFSSCTGFSIRSLRNDWSASPKSASLSATASRSGKGAVVISVETRFAATSAPDEIVEGRRLAIFAGENDDHIVGVVAVDIDMEHVARIAEPRLGIGGRV